MIEKITYYLFYYFITECDINTINDNSFVFIKPERDLLISSIDTYQSDLIQSFEKISQLQNEKIPTIHNEGYLLNTVDNTTNIYNELYNLSYKCGDYKHVRM